MVSQSDSVAASDSSLIDTYGSNELVDGSSSSIDEEHTRDMNGAASGLRPFALLSLTNISKCGVGQDVSIVISLTLNDGSGVDTQDLNCSMSSTALVSGMRDRAVLLDRGFVADFVAFFVVVFFFSIVTPVSVDTCATVDKHGSLSVTVRGSATRCACCCCL